MACSAVDLGGVKITLESQRYYQFWDLTRLIYRVKGNRNPGESWWTLSLGSCVTADLLLWWASSPFEWVDEPFRGVRFDRTSKNQKFTLWLVGQWDVAETDVLLAINGGAQTFQGDMDGPACEGASIALDTISGEAVSFPAFEGVGTYPGDGWTVLRVTSTSSGWSLSHDIQTSVPEGASSSVVERILSVSYDPFVTAAGMTDVRVRYMLNVEEADLAGLPQGTYVIQITYTASTD